MPIMNGVDATRAIRKGGYTGLIVGVTGDVGEAERQLLLEAGADVVLAKPLSKADLAALLYSHYCAPIATGPGASGVGR